MGGTFKRAKVDCEPVRVLKKSEFLEFVFELVPFMCIFCLNQYIHVCAEIFIFVHGEGRGYCVGCVMDNIFFLNVNNQIWLLTERQRRSISNTT